jgi:hypothetical protein
MLEKLGLLFDECYTGYYYPHTNIIETYSNDLPSLNHIHSIFEKYKINYLKINIVENQQINELRGIKKVFDNPMDYVESLGFKYIGVGSYGITYMGSKSVLKIFYDDLAYEKYISLYKHIPNEFRKFMPKNNGVKVWPTNEKYKVIKLEKLDRLSVDIIKKFKESGFKMYFEQNTFEIIKAINQSNGFEDFIKKIILTDSYYQDILTIYQFIGFEMLQFIAYLYKYIDFFKFDLHSGNFMLRGKQLVLIDPWYEG